VERQIRDLGDRVPSNEKARAEQLIQEIRDVLKSASPDLARLRQLTSDLRQVSYALNSASSQATSGQTTSGQTASGQANSGRPQTGDGDGRGAAEDVIDAEFKQTK
jgi:molecular chaperone DnaK